MYFRNLLRWAGLLVLPALACGIARVTPQPVAEFEQHTFEIQTATPTVGLLADAPTDTPDPRVTLTPQLTATIEISGSLTLTTTTALTANGVITTEEITTLATVAVEPEAAATEETADDAEPAAVATPASALPPAEPLQGGVWDFEEGFETWLNPYGDECPSSGLANGWVAFTSRDQYGSSCMNRTVWEGNVYSGKNAQEITFAYVGVEAGIYRTAPTIPGHRYSVEAYMKREASPAKVEVFLGLDPTGGTNWQAESVEWFPWDEDVDGQWAKTTASLTATEETMTVFFKGSHPYPEPGGSLQLDAVSVVDNGPAPNQ